MGDHDEGESGLMSGKNAAHQTLAGHHTLDDEHQFYTTSFVEINLYEEELIYKK